MKRNGAFDGAEVTETFWTRHVRLITFLVCITVFSAVFLPLAYFGVDHWIDRTRRDDRAQMTLEDVIRLSESDRDLYLTDLTVFCGETSDFEHETHYIIEIEPSYYLRAVAERDTGKLLYFEMVNFENGKQVDILTEDVRAFLNTQ